MGVERPTTQVHRACKWCGEVFNGRDLWAHRNCPKKPSLVPRRQEEHDREAEEFGFLDERDMLETASAWGWQPGRLAYLFGYQTSTIAKRMRKLKLTNLMYDLKPSDRKELGRQLRAISNLERRT